MMMKPIDNIKIISGQLKAFVARARQEKLAPIFSSSSLFGLIDEETGPDHQSKQELSEIILSF